MLVSIHTHWGSNHYPSAIAPRRLNYIVIFFTPNYIMYLLYIDTLLTAERPIFWPSLVSPRTLGYTVITSPDLGLHVIRKL